VLLANFDNFWEPLFSLLSHMRQTQFIRDGLSVDILKADRVEEILPKLKAAAAQVADAQKDLAPEVARRL
jgi:predicted Rossmann-fold nucleotide-binding protein